MHEHDEAAEPRDTAGELSHLEMGLWRYCYDNNRQIMISVGDSSFIVEMNPDLSTILDELRDVVICLSSGQDAKLSLYELGVTLYLSLTDTGVKGILVRDGYTVERQEFKLFLTQVVDQLRILLNGIVQDAVGKGYITKVEAQGFLAGETV